MQLLEGPNYQAVEVHVAVVSSPTRSRHGCVLFAPYRLSTAIAPTIFAPLCCLLVKIKGVLGFRGTCWWHMSYILA